MMRKSKLSSVSSLQDAKIEIVLQCNAIFVINTPLKIIIAIISDVSFFINIYLRKDMNIIIEAIEH